MFVCAMLVLDLAIQLHATRMGVATHGAKATMEDSATVCYARIQLSIAELPMRCVVLLHMHR